MIECDPSISYDDDDDDGNDVLGIFLSFKVPIVRTNLTYYYYSAAFTNLYISNSLSFGKRNAKFD